MPRAATLAMQCRDAELHTSAVHHRAERIGLGGNNRGRVRHTTATTACSGHSSANERRNTRAPLTPRTLPESTFWRAVDPCTIMGMHQ
jgi:hypothetical protein